MTTHLSPVPLDRQWFTWSERPAACVFLPLGLAVTPLLYSTRAGRVSRIEPRRDEVRFGRHAIDGAGADLRTVLGGTAIGLSHGAPDPFVVRGDWERIEPGEWGARFWVILALSAEDGAPLAWDASAGAVTVARDGRWATLATADAPLLVTGHCTIDALCQDIEMHGYFDKRSRANEAPVLGLRFNLDLMPRGGWAASIADARDDALAAARSALAAPVPVPGALHEGHGAGALDAVRDILGWNTVWDAANARPTTAVSRIWNLGTYAVWYNDQCYAALLAGLLDDDLARLNMGAAHAGATPAGNVACLVSSRDAWVDRSQPPLGGLVAWMSYLRTGERAWLAEHYEALVRNHRWWRRMRDPDGSGLLCCGTSPVGDGLYRGTRFAARNETGMDNSATHDDAHFDAGTGTLSTWDVGLNAAVALDAEMLSLAAGALGHADDARDFADHAARHRDLIRARLWDPARRLFANRQRDGAFVAALSPTSFYPMLCGAADREQIDDLLRHLDDPRTFRAPFVLPNATRDSADYAAQSYWRGRIWPNVNYLVWLGLRRAGARDRAAALATEGHALFRREWDRARIAGESYNAETGAVVDDGDADPFYTWAALLPMMAVEEICGVTPWDGWCLSNGPDCRLGPLRTPLGPAVLRRGSGWLSVARPDGRVWLETDHPGRLSQIAVTPGHVGMELSDRDVPVRIALPAVASGALVRATLGREDLVAEAGDTLAFVLPAGAAARLDVWLRPGGRA